MDERAASEGNTMRGFEAVGTRAKSFMAIVLRSCSRQVLLFNLLTSINSTQTDRSETFTENQKSKYCSLLNEMILLMQYSIRFGYKPNDRSLIIGHCRNNYVNPFILKQQISTSFLIVKIISETKIKSSLRQNLQTCDLEFII